MVQAGNAGPLVSANEDTPCPLNRIQETIRPHLSGSLQIANEAEVGKLLQFIGATKDRILAELADTFKVLGDATRVRILHALSMEELCVCDIAALIGATQSAISHQLRLLRAARLVKFRKKGKMAYYSLDDDHIRNLFEEGIRHVEEI